MCSTLVGVWRLLCKIVFAVKEVKIALLAWHAVHVFSVRFALLNQRNI
jgi:hypothetical protein